jgi:Zn-dependent peptidase ImmA (M78 family)/transcriptional regulator with XRE-family HTH domain
LPKNCKFVKLTVQGRHVVAKSIISRVDRNLARRLREARREVGMSTRAVVAKLPKRATISHATLASYENGVTMPPIDILAALAGIYRRSLNWFLDSRESLTGFRYRNLGSRVGLTDQRKYAAVAGKWADAYFNLERHLNQHRPVSVLTAPLDNTATSLAETVRRQSLHLDDRQPVQNTICALESFSAWALELRASFGVDGAAAKLGGESVIIINPEIANDRVRLNAALELAYLLFETTGLSSGLIEPEIERHAYDFACSLLMPESQLRAAFDGTSVLRLIEYKERFGIGLAAMLHRAEKLKVINTTAYRWLWAEFGRRGWRQKEPGYVWRDRALGFEILLESAIHSKRLTWVDAERVTGVQESELRQRIDEALRQTAQVECNASEESPRATTLRVARTEESA